MSGKVDGDGKPMAPDWVEAVTPEEIVNQRARGWPDFHPEDFCHRCGRRNVCWWADSALFDEAVEGRERGVLEILCPTCFIRLHEQATGRWRCWEVCCDDAHRQTRHPEDHVTVAPSPNVGGRVCVQCGETLVPAGPGLACPSCGTTTGAEEAPESPPAALCWATVPRAPRPGICQRPAGHDGACSIFGDGS